MTLRVQLAENKEAILPPEKDGPQTTWMPETPDNPDLCIYEIIFDTVIQTESYVRCSKR